MSNQVDLYNSTYGNFKEQVLAEVRLETYGEDVGQNSWITTDEYDTLDSIGNKELVITSMASFCGRHEDCASYKQSP